MREKRLGRIQITPRLLLEALHLDSSTTDIINCRIEMDRGNIEMVVESDSLPKLADGSLIPACVIMCEIKEEELLVRKRTTRAWIEELHPTSKQGGSK